MNFVKGSSMSEPVIAQKSPYGVDVEAGKEYWWCACGKSQSQPFCDGAHKGTGLSPQQYTAAESAKVWFCGCKHTADVPMCDGSHSKI
jgi:CDGSH iron-sulfur domain-containing protein 3